MSVWTPCARAYVRNNSGFYSLQPAQYESLLLEWQSGHTFFHGRTLDGDRVTIKLAEVEAVMFCTAESLEAAAVRGQRESKAIDRESYE